MRVLLLLSVGLLAAACASGPRSPANSSAPGFSPRLTESGFPTKDSLSELASAPRPKLDDATRSHDPEVWKLPGPFPPDHALRNSPGQAPWDQMLAAKAAPTGGAVVASAAMKCVADALAQFYLQFDAFPSATARIFLLGRCRASPSVVSIQSLGGEVPPEMQSPALYAQWRGDVEKLVGEVQPGRFESIGLGFARADGRAFFVVARGERRALLEPVRVESGEAVVRGQLLVPDASMRANVNQGAFGYAQCAQDASVKMPAFELRCPLAAGDASTWVQIASFPPGRVLGKTVAHLLVAPQGEPPDVLERRAFAGADAEVTRQSLSTTFLAAVNGVRAQAGLSPLEIEPVQSREAAKLAPHYFHAQLVSQDMVAAETIYLGLRAGWQVSETVRYGLVSSSVSAGARTLRFLLGGLLELPFGRETLLDPQVRRIAVGPVWEDQPPVMGVVVGTYALFDDVDPKTLAEQAYARLDAARRANGLPPATRIERVNDAGPDRALAVLDAGQSPDQALRALLGQASKRLNATVGGFRMEANALDQMPWPDELTKQPDLRVYISVGWHRPPDEPWGRYVVFCAYPSGPAESI